MVGREADSGPGVSVIGRFPEYLEVAERLGARRFDVPSEIWSKMTSEERWAANAKFLDGAIARGDEFVLASPLSAATEGTTFLREVRYLLARGYRLSSDATRLLPPGDV